MQQTIKTTEMKKYTTEMAKLITLIIITPLLVMAYTKIENSVSGPTIHEQPIVTGATPVSIEMMDNRTMPALENVNINSTSDYILVRTIFPVKMGLDKSTASHAGTSNRVTLVAL